MNPFEHYCKQINELVNNCEDIELLDFIFQMLQKRPKQSSQLCAVRE